MGRMDMYLPRYSFFTLQIKEETTTGRRHPAFLQLKESGPLNNTMQFGSTTPAVSTNIVCALTQASWRSIATATTTSLFMY